MPRQTTMLCAILLAVCTLSACGQTPTARETPAAEQPAAPTMPPPIKTAAPPTPTLTATQSPTETAIPVTDTPTGPTATPIDPRGQEVVLWHTWGFGPAAAALAGIVAEFNATNAWGITVTLVDQGRQTDLEDAVLAAMASGELPNLSPGFPNSITSWYDAGLIAPLDDLFADPAFGVTADEYLAIHPANRDSGNLADGTQIGLPIHQSLNVIFYNYTWARELGFATPPATSAEFADQACAAAAYNNSDADPANDGTGGFVHYPGASNIASWLFAFRGSFLTEDGTSYLLDTPEMAAVADFLNGLRDAGCSFATDSFPNPEFAERLALFTTSSTAGIPFQLDAMEEAGNPDEWGLIPFPGPDGRLAVNAFGQLVGIFDHGPEANLAAWLWLRYFTSPEVQAEWIASSGYFPSQTTTEAFLGDYLAANPIYASGLALSQYGQSEPNLASWSAVRSAIQDAFTAIQQAATREDILNILADLQLTADELLAQSP